MYKQETLLLLLDMSGKCRFVIISYSFFELLNPSCQFDKSPAFGILKGGDSTVRCLFWIFYSRRVVVGLHIPMWCGRWSSGLRQYSVGRPQHCIVLDMCSNPHNIQLCMVVALVTLWFGTTWIPELIHLVVVKTDFRLGRKDFG